MKVVRADDVRPVDLVRGQLRYVGLIISFAVIFIGVIWAAFDSRKQGRHDKIAVRWLTDRPTAWREGETHDDRYGESS
jgi:cbb3-type cytochrome oxidase subunit 3